MENANVATKLRDATKISSQLPESRRNVKCNGPDASDRGSRSHGWTGTRGNSCNRLRQSTQKTQIVLERDTDWVLGGITAAVLDAALYPRYLDTYRRAKPDLSQAIVNLPSRLLLLEPPLSPVCYGFLAENKTMFLVTRNVPSSRIFASTRSLALWA